MRQLLKADYVVGIDLSLTAPGIARMARPWGDEAPHAVASTLDRVPTMEATRGLVLLYAAQRIAGRAITMVGGDARNALVVMEAVLLQSTTGKATERAAFWWMVRAQLEKHGFHVASVHPTARRSIAMDGVAREQWRAAPSKRKTALGKRVALESVRRRWSGVVLPDDNAADALVCAEVGAHALDFGNMPEMEKEQAKSLRSAVERLGITGREIS